MIVKAGFRHRAKCSESVELRHAEAVRSLGCPLREWLGAFGAGAVYFESESKGGGAADLSPALRDGVAAAISYCSRPAIDADHAMYDDVLTLEFDESGVDYSVFSLAIFGQVVRAFDAYRASIVLDEDLDLDDYDEILDLADSTGRDVDGRDGVFRISPICFFDRELCARAFGISPEGVSKRINGRIEFVSTIHDGVLIVVTQEIVGRDALIDLDLEVREMLGASIPGETKLKK